MNIVFILVLLSLFGLVCIAFMAVTIWDMARSEDKLANNNAANSGQGAMQTYVAFRNLDKTQTGLCLKENYAVHRHDVDANDMPIILEFRAASWEEASARFDKFLDGELL